MAEVKDFILKNSEVKGKLEQMLNNKKYSDTTFLVNQVQYHVSSHLVTIYSPALYSMVDTHFQNCGDREIRIGQVRHDESFLFLLKYMYDVDINLTSVDKAVLCEVLNLSERYELTGFSKDLKSYLSTLDCFQLESVVFLLNTAKKFDLKQLYEKSSIFAHKNADLLVKHETFMDLQYDVLLDLLKCDWFYAKEMDIFIGALKWHSNNMTISSRDDKELLQKIGDSESVLEELDYGCDRDSTISGGKIDEIVGLSEEFLEKQSLLEESGGCSSKVSCQNETTFEVDVPSNKENTSVVKTFSENVLKALTLNIRFKQISAFDYVKMSKSQFFEPYRELVSDEEYFSPNSNPRIKYPDQCVANMSSSCEASENILPQSSSAEPAKSVGLKKSFLSEHKLSDVMKKFNIRRPRSYDVLQESVEEYLLAGLRWKVSLKTQRDVEKRFCMRLYFDYTADETRYYQSTISFSIKFIGKDPDDTVEYGDPSEELHLYSKHSSIEALYITGTHFWYNQFNIDDFYQIEVHFDSIHTKHFEWKTK